jgi:hypothetical protein
MYLTKIASLNGHLFETVIRTLMFVKSSHYATFPQTGQE